MQKYLHYLFISLLLAGTIPLLHAQENKCSSSENFISERPLPLLKTSEKLVTPGTRTKDIDITGTIFGHGKVVVNFMAKGNFGNVERTENKGVKNFQLSEKGEEKTFNIKINVPDDWDWTAEAKNIGDFKGYCTSQAEETAKNSTRQKYLEPPKVEVNQTNITNNYIINRRPRSSPQ